jgi:hypothetical protein
VDGQYLNFFLRREVAQVEEQEVKKQQAVERVQKNHILLEMYEQEKSSIDNIIAQALNYPPGANRWLAYEALKKQAALIVKRYASYSCASPFDCYCTITDFIDYLLPPTADESDILGPTCYIDQDSLLYWATQAQKSLESEQVKNILA